MKAQKPASPYKRFFKLLLVTTLVFLVVVAGLHIWFVNNARGILQQIVTTKSHGKIKLELSQLRFEFLSNKLQIREADLVSTDTVTQATTYHVKFRKLTLKVSSFWPLVFEKKMSLDSIKLHDPEIEVFQWRKDTSSKFADDELSISQEMGRLYNSMLDVLDNFGIRRIIINNAKLSLVNKYNPKSPPVTMSRIYFDLFRTAQNIRKRDEFVKDAQSVELTTTNQNINLPSGRHRLAFKNFRLELFQKQIELDSCTITKIATDSSKSTYQIFFKKLLLLGVDFNAMYTQNLIRADSVYCENPLFDIDINPDVGTSKKKRQRPDPDKIIKDLTGDLDLAFVGVKDAGIKINISGKKSRSLFNSNKDDFEMRGLRIYANSARPASVDRFDMLVRDYRLYNVDSSAAYSFDSIHFLNNKIALNNFSIEITSQNKEHNKKDFRIPYFELTGLDWYELIFEENLKAQEASLYNPIIKYTRSISRQKKKLNLFTTLQGLDTLFALRKINIINGQIDMKLGATSLSFQNANVNIYSDRLLQSRNKEGLRKAVDQLNFSTGIIKLKNITARLEHVRYTDKNFIRADKVSVNSTSNSITASLRDVAIDNLLLDDAAQFIIVDGMSWDQGSVAIKPLPAGKRKKNAPGIEIRNVSAGNTQFSFTNGATELNTFVRLLRLTSLFKEGDNPLQVQGLSLAGNKFNFTNGKLQISSNSYIVSDNKTTYLTGTEIRQIKDRDSLLIAAPRINFVSDINSILAKDIHFTSLNLERPVIQLNKWGITQAAENSGTTALQIDNVTATEPSLSITTHRNDSVSSLSIPFSAGSTAKASRVSVNEKGLSIGSFALSSDAATFTTRRGDIIGVKKGRVDLELSDIKLETKEGKPSWDALVTNLYLQNPNSFFLGKSKNKLLLEQLAVGNIQLSSANTNITQVIHSSVAAWLRSATGQYVDSATTLKWYNAGYNYSTKALTLDSFNYHPTQPRDSVIARSPYQTDYITLNTGAVHIADFDLESYQKDSALITGEVDIDRPVISIYRDKLPPFKAGIIKPLPVDIFKRIGVPLTIKRINLSEGLVTYTEKSAKTRTEGTVLLTHVDGKISRIKNRNIGLDDSLVFSIDAYLMDSALIKLRVKESYTDPFSGFLMTLRMTPTSLTFLNPVIAPLSNVKIVSGTIDSFALRAIGKEDMALGEVAMYYHDLRIKVYKNAELNQSSFGTNLITFLANTFVIRKNNNGRPGIVYFERLRDRSFFNYIVKMTFSGMAASIGVKKNKKYIKQYEKQLELKKLPPITELDFQLKR
jgi:hypothetical protein